MSEPTATAVLPKEVAGAFISSAIVALNELAHWEALCVNLTPATAVLPERAVVATMRLMRPVPGTMTLVLPAEMALRLAQAYLPAGAEATNEIIQDVAGEFANVIAGQTKTILKGTPFHFTLSIPAVAQNWPPGAALAGAVAIAVGGEQEPVLLAVELRPCSGA